MNKIAVLISLCLFVVASCSSLKSLDIRENKYRASIVTPMDDEEGEILNELFDSVRGDFDFKGKKIAFMGGGLPLISFDDYVEGIFRNSKCETDLNSNAVGWLYLFSDEEIKDSCGFDAAVYSWMKIRLSREKILRILRNKCYRQGLAME
ncbi:MAG: hypothetical protein NC127_05685 [Muribaculum sp.]|nr:hypothetical protein [Muribaculum sp.]